MAKWLQQTFHKWPINMEVCSILLVIREAQIKITIQSHYIPTRLLKWKRLTVSSAIKDGERLKPSYAAGGYGCFGKLWPVAQIHLILSEMHMYVHQKMYKNGHRRTTAVPPYVQGMCFKTPSGFLKPWIVPNPIYTVLSLHTYLWWSLIYKLGALRD